MPTPSSITLALALQAAGYLIRRSLTPPHSPPPTSSTTSTPDRVRVIAGPITAISTHLISLCLIYHALIALLYPDHDAYARILATGMIPSREDLLTRICPHPTHLPAHLFTWNPTTTLCLVSIALGAFLRLAAFQSLGRNFTFELAQPDTLITTGMYRFVQHPSYTGLWLLAAGQLGLIVRWDGAVSCIMSAAISNGLSGWGQWILGGLVAVLMVSTGMRIRDEEQMLQTKFETEWEEWHARTARLIPFKSPARNNSDPRPPLRISAMISLPPLPPTELLLTSSPSPIPSHPIPSPTHTMGFLRSALKVGTIGGAASVGLFFAAVRKNTFEPMTPADPIFQHPLYQKLNPSNNPPSYDVCVRRVPLKDINPALLEKKGKLTEAFCAGVWSGFGYAYQRRYLSKKYEGPETATDLWTRAELRANDYELGTRITDHFEVVEKTEERIVVRCGDSPRKTDVRESDGLFEMSAVVKPELGVAEFSLKSLFFQGKGEAQGEPMPSHILWLHKQYTKLWLETALGNVYR
ncbi:hypothetical protein BO71DRAFT_451852 [Aspergillus ellipticus CBS 707.79]|uniref:Protein-S-isoprenylcysteine O-methyltransferase n=1 Tax=Aspergillus ellipticus CBS 707.79 TaxID=1448320 RepID=A0A319DKP1_9EURO|nr:hypothetical protein BO71DRAFT_451852 [Aspergillus ellipticus CBS 707.79]